MPRKVRSKSPAVMRAPAPEPAAAADEPPLPPLLRTAIVMVGALLLAVSSGSKLRVEMACETGTLLEGTRFCAWSPGRRIQVCAALFAAVFLFDIVLVVLYSFIEAVVAVARAACRAPSAFADLAHEALVEWRRRRKAAARRNRQALRDAEADKERRAERKREAEATWRRARERSQKKAQEKPKKKPPRPRSAPPKPKPKPKATVPPESERHQTPPATPPEPKREIESDAGVLEHKGAAAEAELDAGVPESQVDAVRVRGERLQGRLQPDAVGAHAARVRRRRDRRVVLRHARRGRGGRAVCGARRRAGRIDGFGVDRDEEERERDTYLTGVPRRAHCDCDGR